MDEKITRDEILKIDAERLKIQDAMDMIKMANEVGSQIQAELDKIKLFEQKNDGTHCVVIWHPFYEDEEECPIDEEVLVTTTDDEVCIDVLKLDKKNYRLAFEHGIPGKEVIAWAKKPEGYKV